MDWPSQTNMKWPLCILLGLEKDFQSIFFRTLDEFQPNIDQDVYGYFEQQSPIIKTTVPL